MMQTERPKRKPKRLPLKNPNKGSNIIKINIYLSCINFHAENTKKSSLIKGNILKVINIYNTKDKKF